MATTKPIHITAPSAPDIKEYGTDYTKYVQHYHQYLQLVDHLNAGRLAPSGLAVASNLVREAVGVAPKYEHSRYVPPPSSGLGSIEDDLALIDSIRSGELTYESKVGTPGPTVRRPTPPLAIASPVPLDQAKHVVLRNEDDVQREAKPNVQALGVDPSCLHQVEDVAGRQCLILHLPKPMQSGQPPFIGHKSVRAQLRGEFDPETVDMFLNNYRVTGSEFDQWIKHVRNVRKVLEGKGVLVKWHFSGSRARDPGIPAMQKVITT
jgi:hypothetical protein